MDVIVVMALWILLLSCNVFTTSGSASAPPVTYGYEDPSKNLVYNWDFEEDFDPNHGDWFTQNAEYSFENDAYTGNRSIRVYNRTSARFTGVIQDFGVGKMKPHTTYYVSMFIKTPNNPSTGMFGTFRIMVSSRNKNGGQIVAHNIARIRVLRAGPDWHQIGGDYQTPDEVDHGRFMIMTSPPDFEYLLDTVSVIELPYNKNWKRQTDIDIDKYRKNMLSLNMHVPKTLKAFCKVKVELTQKKRHFGIGTSIKADYFKSTNAFGVKYRDFFFKNFEWAVFENDMKWKPMEKWKGSPKFDRVDTSLDYLEEHNVTVRGHSVLWSVDAANPSWVVNKKGEELLKEVEYRIKYVVEHFKGRLVEWDVINEYLHSQFYTANINDSLLIDKVHKQVHDIDPDVRLFLNDYECVRSSDYTSAIVYLAKTLMSRGAPVHGIGVQSHMRSVPVSPEAIQKRLQIATSIGLPVTLTELSIHTSNVTLRAWMLELLLRMAFSNPGVEAVIFWDFSDLPEIGFEVAENKSAFFNGKDFWPNEAGRVLQNLLKEWRTSKTFQLKSRYMQGRISAFHGLYEAKVYYKDKYIKNVTFYLHPGQDLRFEIPLTADEVESVDDGDPDDCGVWVPETDTDDDDKLDPSKKGRVFDRLSKWKKKTKVQLMPYVIGRNIAAK